MFNQQSIRLSFVTPNVKALWLLCGFLQKNSIDQKVYQWKTHHLTWDPALHHLWLAVVSRYEFLFLFVLLLLKPPPLRSACWSVRWSTSWDTSGLPSWPTFSTLSSSSLACLEPFSSGPDMWRGWVEHTRQACRHIRAHTYTGAFIRKSFYILCPRFSNSLSLACTAPAAATLHDKE